MCVSVCLQVFLKRLLEKRFHIGAKIVVKKVCVFVCQRMRERERVRLINEVLLAVPLTETHN